MKEGKKVKLIDADKDKVNWGGNDDPSVHLKIGKKWKL